MRVWWQAYWLSLGLLVIALNNFGELFVKTPEPPTHQSVSFAGNVIP